MLDRFDDGVGEEVPVAVASAETFSLADVEPVDRADRWEDFVSRTHLPM